LRSNPATPPLRANKSNARTRLERSKRATLSRLGAWRDLRDEAPT
jgi:hypothetical protein